ncbi:proline iminopeptidase protein [Phellopilus nigrolimitatus]|nr:proline iminopeptidase protein [Phellopilus nigrolimitatus]
MSDSASATPPTTEGTLPFRVGDETFQTYYKIVGDLRAGRPLVTLHGGPGSAHYYLLSLADLAHAGRAVVFYDQLGTANSTHLPHKPSEFWTPKLFMDELENLLAGLAIADDFDLLGHSWGGMLGAQFAATRAPKGLKKLVLSDSPASMPLWEEVAAVLVAGMPEDVQATLKEHEDAGTTDSKEYEEAMDKFYAKHLCRLQPMPSPVAKSFQCMSEDPTVYHTMNGPSEFHITGSLKTWTIIPELHRVQAPTLLLNSRYDEAQDKCVQPYFQHIPRVKWYTFAEGSHMPHWEERDLYMKVVGDFLDQKL